MGAARASDSEASLERVVISRLATVVVRHHGQELGRCRSASSEMSSVGPRTRRRSAPASVGVGRRAASAGVHARPLSPSSLVLHRLLHVLLVPSHTPPVGAIGFDGAVSRAGGATDRPPVRRSGGGAAETVARCSVSQSLSVSYFTVLPRAHPSTGSQSRGRSAVVSAAPVQPQVPSTNRVLAPPGARGLLNDCGASRRGREVIVLSPSEQGVPCRFLPCTAGAGLC